MLRRSILALALFATSACAQAACNLFWDVDALADTQVENISLYDRSGRGTLQIPTSRLRSLVRVKEHLDAVAKTRSSLWICDGADINAWAASIDGRRLVIFPIGMLHFLNWDEEMISAVMGHEIGHLAARHSYQARMAASVKAVQAALAKPKDAAGRGGLTAVGLDNEQARALIKALFFKFSRNDELEADQLGIKYLAQAGRNPEAAIRVHLTAFNKFGAGGGGYLDSHPSWPERISRLRDYVSHNQVAKDAIASARQRTANDDTFRGYADRLLQDRKWSALSTHAEMWLAFMPGSSLAWHFRGLALQGGRRQPALVRQSFQRAVEFAPDSQASRLELCVALYAEGRKLDSVNCARGLDAPESKAEFRARTFGDTLYTAGPEPFSSVVVVSGGTGSRYVTNDREGLKRRGLAVRDQLLSD
jgi:predicted Zn-dependent protease